VRAKIHRLAFASLLPSRLVAACIAFAHASVWVMVLCVGGGGNMRLRITLVNEVKSSNLRIGHFVTNKKSRKCTVINHNKTIVNSFRKSLN